MSEIKIPQVWQEWVDHNLDRGVDTKLIIKAMFESGKFSLPQCEKTVEAALVEHRRYADFIAGIEDDFNDAARNELNMQNLRRFLDEERIFSSAQKITKRLEDQWLALDDTFENLEIRARKFAFFHAMDYLILAYRYDFPYPDPLNLNFFPMIDALGNVADKDQIDDRNKFENANSAAEKIQAIAKIHDENLYLAKDEEDQLVHLGKGIHGKVFEGFYRDNAVAIKFLSLDHIKPSLVWQKILVFYRQSKIVFEHSYDNVLPMLDVFFFCEKAVFDEKKRIGMVAIYPLCDKSFYDVVAEDGMIFDSYSSLHWMKKLLQTLVTLHQNDIAVHDFVAQNIMFDFDGNAMFHDFDYWLPLSMSDLRSAYTQRNVMGSGYSSLQEIDFMVDHDVKKIVPEKIDIWCFAITLLVGRGNLKRVESIRKEMVEMLRKYSYGEGRNSEEFLQKIEKIKAEIVDFVESSLHEISQKAQASSDLTQKNFLTDLHHVLKNCLKYDANERWSAQQLLDSPLFNKI